MSNLRCKNCGSYAINDHLHGRPEDVDWMEDAYNVSVIEKVKVVRVFEKLI